MSRPLEQRVARRLNRAARAVKPYVPAAGPVRDGLQWVRNVLPREKPRADHPFSKVLFEFGRTWPRATFVQVGANDGVGRDPLHDEIRARAWTGLMVEPVPYVFARLQQSCGGLERVQLVNAAVADEDGSRTIYYLPESDDPDLFVWYDALASFDEAVIRKHVNLIPDIDDRIESMEVPCLTFASLCAGHGIDHVDVVQIDTEGYDWEVIKLIDLDRYGLTLLMFEHAHLSDADRADCYAHLRRAGFAIYVDVMDALCLRTAGPRRIPRRLGRLWREISADERVAVP